MMSRPPGTGRQLSWRDDQKSFVSPNRDLEVLWNQNARRRRGPAPV